MTLSRQSLINNFASSVMEGDAALFIGAGMSRQSGFVDWKDLLRECGSDLGLNLDREHDFVNVAQYYLNNRNRDRSRLNQIIKEEFDRHCTLSEKHHILARLPISTVWTTNFDCLIERAMQEAGRTVDIKSRDQDVALHHKGRDVVLYKMHGDVKRPDEVIICRDDYEGYAKRHRILQTTLEGDLISKTFLFLGFSFTDPNLKYVFGHLRSMLFDSKREHYTIIRKARLNWHIKDKKTAEEEFNYQRNKEKLLINDLQRYSIQTYLIDKFDDIEDILRDIEKSCNRRNVFVSGSAYDFGELGEDRIRDLCMSFGEKLVENNYCLISGMGINIGDSVVKGALLKLYETNKPVCEKNICIRPFPRNLGLDISAEDIYQSYREDLLGKAGFAVFISGNSRSARHASRGVMNEYDIARQMNKMPIPIGATGFAAREIWQEVNRHLPEIYSGLIDPGLFQKLNDPSLDNKEIVEAAFTIMGKLRNL